MKRQLIGAMIALCLATGANAAITTYASEDSFTAAMTTHHLADFTSFTPATYYAPITDNGITFTSLAGAHAVHQLYVCDDACLENTVSNPHFTLTANGDENFRIELADGALFNAIGFEVVTNRYDAPTLSLFNAGGTLIGTTTLGQAPNSVGYIGLTSSLMAAYAEFRVDRGWIEDTGIAAVRIGMAPIDSVPEPASWALMLIGFGAVGRAMRRSVSGRSAPPRRGKSG